VDKPVEDGVGIGRIADRVVPALDWICVARIVEARWWRSSMTSIRSRRYSAVSRAMAQSSIMSNCILASWASSRVACRRRGEGEFVEKAW